jgi:hypothetical protein
MPYRRLPNTDRARSRALNKALQMGKTVSPVDLAFSQATLQKVKYFLPVFDQTMIQQKQAFSTQIERSKDYIDLYKKAKLYISHFIQVLNMSVVRGELPTDIKDYYELDQDEKRVPTLNTEGEVIKWGDRIIKGEQTRLSRGGNPITNPTIALVKVRYEKFLDAHRKQKSLQEINQRALNKVADLRSEADEIILNVWNEVEEYFDHLSSNERRARAMDYGLVYVYRKNEKLKMMDEEDDDEGETMSLQDAAKLEKKKLQYSFRFSENEVHDSVGEEQTN